MTARLQIRTCPSCGGTIRKVRKNWTDTAAGQKYTVRSLEFYECPDCGEKVFDAEAMHRIESASPAFEKSRQHEVAV